MRIHSAGLLGSAAALLLVAGCGSAEPAAQADPSSPSSPSTTADPDYGDGSWLLRFNTEDGSEGGVVGAVYISYDPSTGAASARRIPGLTEPDTSGDEVAVLVSADQKLALRDARIPAADARRGVLTVYSTTTSATRVVDVRALTGVSTLRPLGAAFDPADGEVLRVVDDARRVWKLDLVAGTGTRDGALPTHAGWFFANGFDKNTGLPYLEDPDSADTLPAGNGTDDVRAVQRRGGTVRIDDGTDDSTKPALPCGFSGGFVTGTGTTWIFCADTPRLSTYRLSPGATAWEKVGTPSAPVIPASADDLPLVLPPVS